MRKSTCGVFLFVLLGLVFGCSARPNGVNTSSSDETIPKNTPPPSEGSVTAIPPGRHHDRGPASVGPLTDEQALDASLAKLRHGNLAYSPQQAMKMGESIKVTARIGSASISLDTLKAGLGPGQSVDVVATPISTKMKMKLTGSEFDIQSLSSEEQFVDDKTPTEWAWQIQPKHPGNLELHLAAVVEVGGLSKDYATVDRQIAVAVNPKGALQGFFNANWQKALYAILAALAAAFWKWITDRKKKADTTGGSPPA